VPGYSRFDYKLKIQTHALEYLKLQSLTWKEVDSFSEADIPLQRMITKLDELACESKVLQLGGGVFYYDYFDANLVHSLSHLELFDFPVFFAVPDPSNLFQLIVYFDVQDDQYHLSTVESMWSSGAEEIINGHYSSHLLKVASEIFKSKSVDEVLKTWIEFSTNVQ
jgi:hypothetical protein